MAAAGMATAAKVAAVAEPVAMARAASRATGGSFAAGTAAHRHDVALIGAWPRHPVVVAVGGVDVVRAIAVDAWAHAHALPADSAHRQEGRERVPAAATTRRPAPTGVVPEVDQGVAARVGLLRTPLQNRARAHVLTVSVAKIDDSYRLWHACCYVSRRRRRAASVALGPSAARVAPRHRRQQHHLLGDQVDTREVAVRVRARAQQELEVCLQAHGGDGHARRRRRREHPAVHLDGVRHLRAALNRRRKVTNQAVDIRERRAPREAQPGSLVSADRDVVAAVPVI
eukprot:6975068-Prymnesium_polylepis.1